MCATHAAAVYVWLNLHVRHRTIVKEFDGVSG